MLAAMAPSEEFPALHPAPALRLAAALGGTFWTLAGLGWTDSPRVAAQAWARRTLRLLGVEARLAAPIPPGAQLWVSNHLSWIDPLVYLSLRPAVVLTKAEVAGYPCIGPGARKLGLRFVDRSDLFSRAAALRGMVRDLQGSADFLLFPEGTTTLGDQLAPLCEGGLRMAYRLGVKLLPLRLASGDAHYPWIGDDSLVPHLQGVARRRRTRVSVHPGTVLDPAAGGGEDRWVEAIRRHLGPAAP
jgi:1-acyl-sn-glycerol-3-phosphate acyltransferase